jgi:hypothetical protein
MEKPELKFDIRDTIYRSKNDREYDVIDIQYSMSSGSWHYVLIMEQIFVDPVEVDIEKAHKDFHHQKT